MQMEAIATNDNSEDGKPWLRSVDAVNINLTQTSYTQMTLTGAPASQAEGGSQVLLAPSSMHACLTCLCLGVVRPRSRPLGGTHRHLMMLEAKCAFSKILCVLLFVHRNTIVWLLTADPCILCIAMSFEHCFCYIRSIDLSHICKFSMP